MFTRIYDRRNRQATERDKRELVQRALKAAKLPQDADDRQKVTALEKYVESLRELQAEFSETYAENELGNALQDIAREIERTVEELARLRMRAVNPSIV